MQLAWQPGVDARPAMAAQGAWTLRPCAAQGVLYLLVISYATPSQDDFNAAPVGNWSAAGKVAGTLQTSNGFSFLRVLAAGHMVRRADRSPPASPPSSRGNTARRARTAHLGHPAAGAARPAGGRPLHDQRLRLWQALSGRARAFWASQQVEHQRECVGRGLPPTGGSGKGRSCTLTSLWRLFGWSVRAQDVGRDVRRGRVALCSTVMILAYLITPHVLESVLGVCTRGLFRFWHGFGTVLVR